MLKNSGLLVLLLLAVTVSGFLQAQDQEYEYDDGGDDEEGEVDEVAPPPVFAVEPQTFTVKEGENVIIPCNTTVESPHVLIIKMDDGHGEKLMFAGEVQLFKSPRHSLEVNQMTILNVKKSDAGHYLCHYQLTPEPVEIRHTLDVLYPPQVKATSLKSQTVKQGSSVTLDCKTRGNPPPTLTWSKKGGLMPSGEASEEGLSITLGDVNRHVEGTYVCTADNGIGDPVSAAMTVTVNYKSEIIIEKAIVRTGEGDRVEIVCLVHSRPQAKIDWYKDGHPVLFNNHIDHHEGGHRHILTIKQVTHDDFGVYQCAADNGLGETTGNIDLTDLPKPPEFISEAVSSNETTYTLAWKTESFYPITEYRVKYRRAKVNDSSEEPGEWVNLSFDVDGTRLSSSGRVHTMRHTLDELESATDYQAIVQVKNKDKWGTESQIDFSTKKEVTSQQTIGGTHRLECTSVVVMIGLTILHLLHS